MWQDNINKGLVSLGFSRAGSNNLGVGIVRGRDEHGEQQHQGYEQVRGVDGHQGPALSGGLRARVGLPGERVQQNVRQDRDQGGGHVCGVDDRRSPDPFASTCEMNTHTRTQSSKRAVKTGLCEGTVLH